MPEAAKSDAVKSAPLKSGRVALVGRPNAGKSTLMNRILGEKLAIVSDKPQTTRQRIVGILSAAEGQIVFFDTPGIHRPLHRLNKRMVEESNAALEEADVIVLVRDVAESFGSGDAQLVERIAVREQPKIVVLNKIDKLAKNKLLPEIARYGRAGRFEAIVPVSSLDGDGVDRLLAELWRLLPEGEPHYDRDLLTTHPERFLVAERIREKLLAATRAELPFTTAVLLESWEDPGEPRALRIGAALLVEKESHRGILIGKGGQAIKAIGTAARVDLAEFLGRKVHLDLRVRFEPDWRENPRILADLERDVVASFDAD
jgi:GTP-binding protein Era